PSFSSSLSRAFSGMRSLPFRWKARAISRLPTGVSLSRMKASTCFLVGKGTALRRGLFPCEEPPLVASALRRLEFDFDKDEFVIVGVDDVVLDPHRTIIGPTRGQFRVFVLLAVIEQQAAGGHRHHDIIIRSEEHTSELQSRENL